MYASGNGVVFQADLIKLQKMYYCPKQFNAPKKLCNGARIPLIEKAFCADHT